MREVLCQGIAPGIAVAASAGAAWSAALWVGVLLGLLAVGVWVIVWARRQLGPGVSETTRAGQTAFTFEELRRMRDEGALSAEEYEALRGQLVASFREPGEIGP